MSLRETVSSRWRVIQGDLFPWLEEAHGFLTPRHRQLVRVLDIAEIEALVPGRYGGSGRPLSERGALARAFVAKAVFNLGTTGALLERLTVDRTEVKWQEKPIQTVRLYFQGNISGDKVEIAVPLESVDLNTIGATEYELILRKKV